MHECSVSVPETIIFIDICYSSRIVPMANLRGKYASLQTYYPPTYDDWLHTPFLRKHVPVLTLVRKAAHLCDSLSFSQKRIILFIKTGIHGTYS